MNLFRKAAWFFAILFFLVFIVTNVPAFNDSEGYNFGLFKIDPIDNVVHLLTALFGIFAAWYSNKMSRFFLVVFGIFYGLDAFVGLTTQKGLLDFSVFVQAAQDMSRVYNPNFSITNILINAPHIAISFGMVVIGAFGYSRLVRSRTIADLRRIR